MNNMLLLVLAYGFIWLVLAYYFYITGQKIKKLEEKIKMLEEDKENN